MKKIISLLFTLLVITVAAVGIAGCNDFNSSLPSGDGNGNNQQVKPDESNKSILIVYFSWSGSGNTKRMANRIAEQTGGDVVEIEAAVPYTGSYNDVAYGRAKEEHDTNARPEVAETTYSAIDLSKYGTVFVGYPIWWWTTPMIIATFLEHYNWTADINIYPFSQSASMNVTQFNTSMEQVRESAAGATVHNGLFVNAGNTSAIDAYLRTNGFIN